MHDEILSHHQLELLPLIRRFKRNFILVGGTAVALHLGHRRSIDFDLFSFRKLNGKSIYKTINSSKWKIDDVFVRKEFNHTMIVHGVQVTFFHYPYRLQAERVFRDTCKIPSLLDLAAMKAFAIGQRGKWKDYVDMYFILRNHLSFDQIVKRTKELFAGEFKDTLFKIQLGFFDDVSYKEKVEYLIDPVPDNVIKRYLRYISLSPSR